MDAKVLKSIPITKPLIPTNRASHSHYTMLQLNHWRHLTLKRLLWLSVDNQNTPLPPRHTTKQIILDHNNILIDIIQAKRTLHFPITNILITDHSHIDT